MSTQREVLQQALEAFHSTNLHMHVAAIDAIRAALAEHTPQQEVQEPVRTSGRNCYLCGHPAEAHPMEPNPRGGMRHGKCPTTTAQPTPDDAAIKAVEGVK